MENVERIDLNRFEEDVEHYTYIIFYSVSQDKTYNLVEGYLENNLQLPKEKNDDTPKPQITVKEVLIESKKKISDHKILKHLCPALASTTKDIREISKVVIGILLPLSIASKIDLEINPLIFAGIIIAIYNAGVTSLCKEIDIKS